MRKVTQSISHKEYLEKLIRHQHHRMNDGAPAKETNYESKDSEKELGELIESLIHQYREFLSDEYNQNKEVPAIISYAQRIPILNRLIPSIDEKTAQINELLDRKTSASSYSEWYEIANKLDELMDHEQWKQEPESNLYDYELLRNSLEEMKQARLLKNYKLLLYLIRTKWVRNMGNMGDISLYKHSFVGTKHLIEEYISECQLSLQYLINDKNVNLDDRYLLGMLIQTRKNIGRTALVLSGGSTFGMFHIGVLLSLLEVNLLPRIISGSSAGSIVASILCCHNNEENRILIETLSEKEFEIFTSEALREESTTSKDGNTSENTQEQKKNQFRRLLKGVGHFLKYGTFFKMEGLKRTIKGFVGDLTFREAYNRTGKILNITVSPAAMHDQTRLLNYLTAPNCLIWSAVCASCSLPGVFPSTSIYEKNPRTNKIQKWNNDSSIKFVDGSVDNDLPITRLLEMFNVDHIIAVQVNPHVVPILKISVSNPGGGTENDLTTRFKGVLNNVYDYFTSEFVHYLQILNEMNVYKNWSSKLISVFSQRYSGDITILPNYKVSDFQKIFVNPTPEFIADFIIRGARATWPKITLINNHCGVEFELDKAITQLRGRLIYSSNAKSSIRSPLVVNSINNSGATLTRDITNDACKSEDSNGSKEGTDKKNLNLHVNTSVYDQKQLPITPERRRVSSAHRNIPSIQRRNSANDYLSGDKAHRRQRNSISNFQLMNHPIKGVNERNSTTSLSAMGYSSYTTPNKKDMPLAQRAYSDYHGRRSSSGKIRKAKSSGNFQLQDDSPINQKYQASRIPAWKHNPYLEGDVDLEVEQKAELTPPKDQEKEDEEGEVEEEAEEEEQGKEEDEAEEEETEADDEETGMGIDLNGSLNIYEMFESFDSDYEIGGYTGYQTPTFSHTMEEDGNSKSLEQERANLPRRSQNNSLTSSYIGLNRLKDANVTKSAGSGSSNHSMTDQTLSLSSPDIRRALSKKFNDLGYDKKKDDKNEND